MKLSRWYCNTCFDELTAEEHKYYDDRCEACERDWHERMQKWRSGAPDAVLDDIMPEIWFH